MAEQVVATEVAEAEFQRIADMMDLDLDPKGWTDEDRKSFDDSRARVVRAIEQGRLVVDDRGQAVFTPKIGVTDPITFYEPTGASFMEMDQAKGAPVGSSFRLLAAMTRQPPSRFANMAYRDLKVCQAILMIFLGSK